MRKLVLLLLAAALGWRALSKRLSPPLGGGERCEPDTRFERTSILRFSGGLPDAPQYSNALSTSEIEALRRDKSLPPSLRVPGLTVAEYGLDAKYRVSSARSRMSRRACVWLDSLEPALGYAKLEVFIAKEYPPGSCEYSEIAVHESLHVAIHRESYAEFRGEVEKAFREAASLPTKANPISAASEEEGRQIVGRLIDRVLDPLRSRFAEELERRQAQIDTPISYRDIQARCRNWRR